MLDKAGNIIDRREMLRVKIKSLAEEARTIRKEERRAGAPLRAELRNHRVVVVRHEARHAHLAYGFLRGLKHKQMEHNTPAFDEAKVRRMLERYGKVGEPVAFEAAPSIVQRAARLFGVNL